MFFVGIDLAWGQNRPSGVAVLDEDGHLVHVSAAVSDDALVAALAPYVDGPCLVAFDAPLVVSNRSGNRPAEAALNRDFRVFDAGAHPSNTSRPELDPPRAQTLAARLGLDLDLDPASAAPRRAIEVYPHPATIALFRLGRTLKYKHKTGRTFADLQTALLRLVDLMETLGAATPALELAGTGWEDLRSTVEDADRKSELRRAEDQVDAVLCAYLGLFTHRRPADVTTYGDAATGAILTPTLPTDLLPDPRTPAQPDVSPPTHTGPVSEAIRGYADAQPRVREATDAMVASVTRLLDDAGVNYESVTGRAKSVPSFAAKAARLVDGIPLYSDPLTQVTDQLGVRVVTFVAEDVDAVVDLLAEVHPILDDRDLGQETASEGRFGYASRHLLLRLPDTAPYAGTPSGSASVQVRTVLQHAWAEFEHDIRYKGTVPEADAPDLDRRFTLAAGLLELADREFSAIRDRIQASMTDSTADFDPADPRISAQELATFLAGRYADAGWSRTDHYAWIAGLLLELGITSLDELGLLLDSVDLSAVSERLGYRHPSRAVRRLDDALLALFGERYIDLTGNAHRVDLLRERWVRMTGG
ncbi:DUF429 domain-containing protein [Nocardioides sp.]|uniref:DUF429 domain-containing protein n=1 Tax=Nocardioides sp. TaxID=35761 RepID=UPI0027342056|nr:DUF429 domain-containing protein [Nocardioides sp.]MDP3894233.1 DUF429 domain-containing protein [Nocardioides sp.]